MPGKPTYEELEQRVARLEREAGRVDLHNGKTETILSQIIQATAIPTFVIDKEHNVTHWNKACATLTGIRADEMIGTKEAWKAFYEMERPLLADLVVEGSSRDEIAEHYEICSNSEFRGDAFEAQGYFSHFGVDGKWLYFTATLLRDQTNHVVGAIETFQDITDRRRAEQLHRLFLEAIPDPVVVYAPNHQITYINEAFEGTYGWSKSELIGGTIDFVPPGEMEKTKDAWRRTLDGEKIFFETKRKTKNGRLLDIQLRTAVIKDKDGNHTASIVIHRDVTAIKKVEQERERLIVELRQALAEVKTLSGFLPICASCKKIRDDKGYWNQIEAYISEHSHAQFSHGVCPDCAKKLYPELFEKRDKKNHD